MLSTCVHACPLPEAKALITSLATSELPVYVTASLRAYGALLKLDVSFRLTGDTPAWGRHYRAKLLRGIGESAEEDGLLAAVAQVRTWCTAAVKRCA